MASAWTATARLAFQQYGGPSLVAGGLMLASSGKSSSSIPKFSSKITACEAPNESNNSNAKTWKRDSFNDASIRRRMTNVGRFSLLSETPSNPSVPVMVMCLSGAPWTAKDFTDLYREREIDQKHERLRSHMDPKNTAHFRVRPLEFSSDRSLPVRDLLAYPQVYRSELKSMITDALLSPMDMDESLWEAWTVTGGKLGQSGAIPKSYAATIDKNNPLEVESLLMFRAHHCMSDGVSLSAIFGDLVDEGEEIKAMIRSKIKAFRKRKKTFWEKLKIFLYYWVWGSLRAAAYQLYLLLNSIVAPNPWKFLKQTAESEADDFPRTLSWAQVASVDEVKDVANYFSRFSRGKVTVNDIFCSCISGAIAKLMEFHRRKHPELDQLDFMNLVMPVHIQGGVLLPGQSIGNKIGALVSRVPSEAVSNPYERLLQVHDVLLERKQTPGAFLSYLIAKTFGGTLGSILGSWTPFFFSKAHANGSVVVTNVRGPEQRNHLAGRRIETTLGFLPLPPGIPLGMVVYSSNQTITLTIMAESWAVPDADLFLSWVVEEYQSLLRLSKAN